MTPTSKVYIVSEYGDEYEDRWEQVIGVCSSYKLAEELKNKYIKLLEEKSEKIDRFTDVYELCKSQEIQIKEYKKELSDTKAEVREYERQLEEEKEKSLNYEEELTKLKKKYKIKEPKSKIEQELDEILNKKEEEKQ